MEECPLKDILHRLAQNISENIARSIIQIAESRAKVQELIQQKKLRSIDLLVYDMLCVGTYTKKEICEKLNISRSTLYRSVDRLKKAEVNIQSVMQDVLQIIHNIPAAIHNISLQVKHDVSKWNTVFQNETQCITLDETPCFKMKHDVSLLPEVEHGVSPISEPLNKPISVQDLATANVPADTEHASPKKEGFPPLYIPPFQERKDCVSYINTHTRNTTSIKQPNKKQETNVYNYTNGEETINVNTGNVNNIVSIKNKKNINNNSADCNDLKVETDNNMRKKEQNEVLFKEYSELLELAQKSDPTPYKKIVELYNTICESLPKVVKLTEQRKRMLKSRWKEYPSLDYFKKVFELAEESDFLSGRRGDWQANFDWLIRPSNFTKVLEGAYTNPDERKQKIYEKKKKRLLGGNPTTKKKNGNGEKEMSAEEKQKFEEKLRELFKGTGFA